MEMVGGCCVCLDERGWDENPLVYCDGDGCNVAVHQACYGIVKVPSGPWFCCKCRSTERVARVKCELCPFKEGALKRTDNGGWAHVVCALYIPEVRFGNVTTMEPIKMSSVPHERFLKTCYICEDAGRDSKTSNGACMSCNKPGCKMNFHVTCAQAKRMLCEEAGHYGNVQYVGYCGQHWGKKFGSRNQVTDHDKKQKEKKRSRNDSTSSSDALKPKKKEKSQGASKSNSTTNTERTSEKPDKCNTSEKSGPSLIKAGSAEKSAAESLNLLQQMPGIINFFPNGAAPKTPLNSLISSEESAENGANFNMANILNSQQDKKNCSSPSAEEIIDVVETGKASDGHGTEKVKVAHKSDDKHKVSSSISGLGGKFASQAKKLTSTQQKGSSHLKPRPPEGKKRKSLSLDGEKSLKKKKVEEKRKAKKKLQKTNDFGIPRPSKTNLFENDRIPSLFPRNFGEKNPESFQDLLEFQWNHGAQFLIQKATHHDVGSLLSCLYQLRAENDDLEKRLEQLSARRDRLIAATTRLSTPLATTPNSEKQIPLSSMLAKLNSESNENDSAETKKFRTGDFCNDSSVNDAVMSLANMSSFENRDVCCKENSRSSIEDLDCKEVLSENSLSGTPPKDIKKSKKVKKDCQINSKDQENGMLLHNTLVQPPIVKPSDSHIVGGITASHMSQSPTGFIHQVVRQQQRQQPHSAQSAGPPANFLDFLNGHSNILGNLKSSEQPARDGRNPSSK